MAEKDKNGNSAGESVRSRFSFVVFIFIVVRTSRLNKNERYLPLYGKSRLYCKDIGLNEVEKKKTCCVETKTSEVES